MTDDCGVCLGDFYPDDTCDFYVQDWRNARKPHKCDACSVTIQPGERYHYSRGLCVGDFGDFFEVKVCSDCYLIREAFTCEHDHIIPAEILWETMRYSVFPQMTTACLGKVKDEHAREVLRTKWMEWKGLTA